MSNLKNFYLQCSKKNFKTLNILSCLIADLFIAFYLYIFYANPKVYLKIFKESGLILKQMGSEAAQMINDSGFQNEMATLMVQTVITIICVYLLIHLIIYFFRTKDANFAKGYLKLYAWTGGALMILTGLLGISTPSIAMFLIPGSLLLLNALGLKYVDQMKEE